MAARIEQLRHLRGGEPMELVNLSREATLRFTLPKIYLAFATQFGSRREDHRGKLTSVLIEPEVMRLSLVWQSVLTVPARYVDRLDQTAVDEKPYLT